MTGGLLLQGARLADGTTRDVRIRGERIESVGPAGGLEPAAGGVEPAAGGVEPAAGEQAVDLSGYVLLPAPAEPHAHLDKALTAERFPITPGDLLEAIAGWEEFRRELRAADIAARADAALLGYLRRGVRAVRTHVDVGEGIDLRAARALVEVRERWQPWIEVQVAALCFPLTGARGAKNRARLREAIAAGVDVVGGAPHVDPDPLGHIESCLEIAAEHRLPVDLHMDEHIDPNRLDLLDLASMAHGFPQRVTASHAVSLGMQTPRRQARAAEALAQAGIGVVALPLTNLYLQARDRPTATPRGITAVRALLQGGVTVCAGADNIQDVFNQVGSGDPLETALLLVAAAHVDCDTAYEMVSTSARKVMGLPDGAIAPGSPAELLAVRGGSVREVIATRSEERIVISGGRIPVRTRVEDEWHIDGSLAEGRPRSDDALARGAGRFEKGEAR